MIRQAILIAILLATASHADVMFVGGTVPLSDLTSGDSITVGDKVFTNFSYLATGDMPDDTNINVQGIIDCEGNYGLRFQGGFLDLPGGGASDALISYNVSVAPGSNMLISDVHIAANLDVVGGGLGLITESFLPLLNDQLTVVNDGVTADLTDFILFDEPVASLPVQKDILLLADDGGVATAFSFVDQSYSQVPEPATGLFVVVAIALGMAKRRGII